MSLKLTPAKGRPTGQPGLPFPRSPVTWFPPCAMASGRCFVLFFCSTIGKSPIVSWWLLDYYLNDGR